MGEHEVHNHVALLFFFMCLTCGAFVMYFLNRCLPWFPYTVALLMIGIITGLIFTPKEKIEAEKGAFAQTIWMWDHISPHLLLFAFLPGLLFADCISMGWHIFCKSLIQCVILAIPGVVMATFMVAGFAMTVFPYGWNFAFAMTFGSILAATDPVAVVAILKSLGAPDALTMLVSGESLLNDGSAIVVFNVFNAMALGTQEKLEEVGVPRARITSTQLSSSHTSFGWHSGALHWAQLSRSLRVPRFASQAGEHLTMTQPSKYSLRSPQLTCRSSWLSIGVT